MDEILGLEKILSRQEHVASPVGLDFQHKHGITQSSITPDSRDSLTSFDLRHTCRKKIYAHNKVINKNDTMNTQKILCWS